MLYEFSRFIGKIITKYYFRIHIEGQENIPPEGPCLIVANHVSFLDPFVICIHVPRIIHYITYAFFHFHPLFHWFCKRVYCIPIKKEGNDISSLKRALRLLKQGEIVGIFPEGARSETGKLSEAAPGVAMIALKAGVPILPVGLKGTYKSFPKGATLPKPTPVTLSFGKPFFLKDHLSVHGRKNGELQQEATNLIMSNIAKLCGQENTFSQKNPQATR